MCEEACGLAELSAEAVVLMVELARKQLATQRPLSRDSGEQN
jgi:hypothetical protein